jgi:hypothetical protein
VQSLTGTGELCLSLPAFVPHAQQPFGFSRLPLNDPKRLLEVQNLRIVSKPPGEFPLFLLVHHPEVTVGHLLSPRPLQALNLDIGSGLFLGETLRGSFQVFDRRPR